ncbi:ATP-NAD kinase N-terminal domain [Popillia japonica]|uniref:NAD(+) kinase n=1 Tax=Popillia japonica TaxID=7064 RepID=A0AAW1MGG9_POPJA
MSTCVVNSMPRWFCTIADGAPKFGNVNGRNDVDNSDTINNNSLTSDPTVPNSEYDFIRHQESNVRYRELASFKERSSTVVRTPGGYRYRTIQDPASQRLTWYKPPLTVLVIKKVRDASVLNPFVQLVQWLIEEKRMVVFVESAVMEDHNLDQSSSFLAIKDKLMTFKEGKDDLTDKIDFIICLGGDGTLLYASHLFQQSVPPVMAFHLGSLGFLTPFQFDNFQEQVTNVLEGNAALTLRSRLRCIVMKKGDSNKSTSKEDKSRKPPTNLLVLNEVVVDRGPSPFLSNIDLFLDDLFLDGKHITSVQGDGLIVSTPTGSTAYAVAAGASMIHPSVPAIMVTPICPHSLSFRPIVVPAGVELKISVSPDSRNTSWVSFDGRNRQELLHGDSLRVTTSIYPLPSICAQDQISDWFDSLAECLHWNVRKRQKHLDELTDLTHSSSDDTLDSIEVENITVDTERDG